MILPRHPAPVNSPNADPPPRGCTGWRLWRTHAEARQEAGDVRLIRRLLRRLRRLLARQPQLRYLLIDILGRRP